MFLTLILTQYVDHASNFIPNDFIEDALVSKITSMGLSKTSNIRTQIVGGK